MDFFIQALQVAALVAAASNTLICIVEGEREVAFWSFVVTLYAAAEVVR